MDRETRKELKRLENKQKEQETLNDLITQETEINNLVDEFTVDAKNELLENNEEGFELIASSIYYFLELKRVIHSVRVQFQTYIKTTNCMQSLNSVKNALKLASKTLESLPSLKANQKDFAKFKRSLMKGQLNMKAITGMMSSINPALNTARTKEEYNALKEKILINEKVSSISDLNTNSKEKFNQNKDFYDKING